MSDFNRQRTIYMTQEDRDLVDIVAAKLERENPGLNLKVRNEYSLSALIRFMLQREVKSHDA